MNKVSVMQLQNRQSAWKQERVSFSLTVRPHLFRFLKRRRKKKKKKKKKKRKKERRKALLLLLVHALFLALTA